jgi:hypothetical protein
MAEMGKRCIAGFDVDFKVDLRKAKKLHAS